MSRAGDGERKAFEGDSNDTDSTWASARRDDALRSYCYERLGMMVNIWGKMILQDIVLVLQSETLEKCWLEPNGVLARAN